MESYVGNHGDGPVYGDPAQYRASARWLRGTDDDGHTVAGPAGVRLAMDADAQVHVGDRVTVDGHRGEVKRVHRLPAPFASHLEVTVGI